MEFEKVTKENFPIEDCTIPLKTNKDYFRAKNLKSVLIYYTEFNSERIENLYPCISSEDSYDILGFVVKEEDFFYTLDSSRHIIKGMANFKDIDSFIEKMT